MFWGNKCLTFMIPIYGTIMLYSTAVLYVRMILWNDGCANINDETVNNTLIKSAFNDEGK